MHTAIHQNSATNSNQESHVRVHRPSAADSRLQITRAYSQQSTVLVAEDDVDCRRLIVDTLLSEGYGVIEVENGRQLARCLMDKEGKLCPRPDLVISDVRMPGHTGLEVLAALRRSNWSMPVILITAFGDAETHEEARRLGAATVLNKPFDLEEMINATQGIIPIRV